MDALLVILPAAIVPGLLLGLGSLLDGPIAAVPGLVDGLLGGRLGLIPTAARYQHEGDSGGDRHYMGRLL